MTCRDEAKRRRMLSRLMFPLAIDVVGLIVTLTFVWALGGDLRVTALVYALGLAVSHLVRGWR
jgi:hypothetical protein